MELSSRSDGTRRLLHLPLIYEHGNDFLFHTAVETDSLIAVSAAFSLSQLIFY